MAPMPALLTVKEALAQLKISRGELAKLDIPHVLLGKRKKRYRQEDIDRFVNSHMRYPPSAADLDFRYPRRTTGRSSMHVPFSGREWREKAKALQRAHAGAQWRIPRWEEAKAALEEQQKKAEQKNKQK